MPITRAMAEQEEKFKQLFAFMQAMKEEMKAGQEEMKKEIFSGQEEMKKGQESMKEFQEEMQKHIAAISAGQGELKSHLLTTMEDSVKKMDESVKQIEDKLEGKLEKVELKMEESVKQIEDKFEEKLENVEFKFNDLEKKFEILEKKNLDENLGEIEEKLDQMLEKRLSSRTVSDDLKCVPVTSRPTIKLSTYDGKTSWQVYKTQFEIVANANGWDSVTKACQLAASLRAEAADILQTLPEEQRLDLNALSSALELRFGEKCVRDYSRLQLKSRQQKATETLQELATDVERLSHLAFADCPADTREILSLQYFVDGIRDAEIQKALRVADIKDLKSALVYAMKYEAAQQATRRERHPIRAAAIQDPKHPIVARMDELEKRINDLSRSIPEKKQSLKCWNCGGEGHIRRNCRKRQETGAETAHRREEGN